MGLAASQARLLTITARLADNELRSQTINNAKMRLATQSAQASDEYVSALNNAQMMFTNTSADGLSQKQALTFNALTQYSQYNNQYGIVNSAGQIMVSEEDAEIFKSHKNNLEGFLKAHNLEWETTFFDESQGNLAEKLTSFYGTGSNKYIGNLFTGKTNEQLKQIYLDSLSQDASIEKLNYTKAAQNYYYEVMSLYENSAPEYRQEIIGSSTDSVSEETIAEAIKGLGNADAIKKALINGILPSDFGVNVPKENGIAKFSLAYLTNEDNQYLNSTYAERLKTIVTSLTDGTDTGVEGIGDLSNNAGYSTEESELKKNENTKTYTIFGNSEKNVKWNSYSFGGSPSFTITFKEPQFSEPIIVYDDDGTTEKYRYQTITGYKNTITCTNTSFKLPDITSVDEASFIEDPNIILNKIYGDTMKIAETVGGDDGKEHKNDSDTNLVSTGGATIYRWININEYTGGTSEYKVCKIPLGKEGDNNKDTVYKAIAAYYLEAVLDTEGAFEAINYATKNGHESLPTLKNFQNAIDAFKVYGVTITLPEDAKCLVDYEEMVKKKLKNGTSNQYMQSVLNTYMADKMLDVLGEPKYAWVDKSDPTNVGNADAKAQWLTNLFNRMQKGYKVLENGLAKSPEWLQYAFESGLVRMEQVDLSYNWVSMDYKSCSNIFEETDNSTAVSKAEAKYNRAMNDIKQKDSMFDLQLKNIDTEHSSLQTEYDVVKGVMNKNIERTMKFNQSA